MIQSECHWAYARRLIASSGGDANDIFLWDAASGEQVGHIVGRGSDVLAAAFSPDGRHFAWGWTNTKSSLKANKPLTASFDLLDFRREGEIKSEGEGATQPGESSPTLPNSLSPSLFLRGRLTSDGYSAEWNAKQENTLIVRRGGRETCRISRRQSYDRIRCYAFLPRRRQLVVGSNYRLTLHDAESGEQLRKFVGHTGIVWAVAVSPDGQTLLSGSSDQTLRLWDLQLNMPVKFRPVIGAISREANGDILITHITSDFPADHGGLRIGDIIETVGGTPVETSDQFQDTIDSNGGKAAMNLRIKRGNRLLTLKVTPRLIVSADTQAPLLNFFFTRDGKDFVAWTDEGYYAASPGGEKLIGWHINRGVDHAADFIFGWQLRRRMYRPEIVSRIPETGSLQKAIEVVNRERRQRGEPLLDIRENQQLLAVPKIRIDSPKQYARIKANTVPLKGVALPAGSVPIKDVRITVNKRPVSGASKGVGVRPAPAAADDLPKGSQFINLDIPLIPGPNLIEVVATTEFATSLPFAVEVVSEATALTKPTLYVLGIGVADYEYDTQPGRKDEEKISLKFSDDDVRGTIAALQAQKGKLYKDVVVTPLIDKDVTDRNIKRALVTLKKSVTQHDIAVLIVSGHGYADIDNTYYFCPHDFDPEEPVVTGIRFTEITEPLANLPCKVVLCMDTCHSGGVLGPKAGATRRNKSISDAVDKAIRDLTSIESGVVVMTSSTGQEVSLEDDAWGHGAFALALIEALTGKRKGPAGRIPLPADLNADKVLELTEIDAYITGRVKELTAGQQHPVTNRGQLPSFPLAVTK